MFNKVSPDRVYLAIGYRSKIILKSKFLYF
jgi:hypothetical protein